MNSSHQSLATRVKLAGPTQRGWEDLVHGLESWRIWHLMGVAMMRKRYSRSRLGQFWITLSMGVMVMALGLTWSILWRLPVGEILPYIAGSLVLWTFITGTINDAANIVITSGNFYLNQNLNFSTTIYASIYNSAISLLHNAIIILVVLALYPDNLRLSAFLFIPGFLLTLITLVWVSCVVAILCTRYRDIVQLVATVLQCALYITPVMFKSSFMPAEFQWINLINPFAIFLSITRDPLFGQEVSSKTWIIATIVAFGGGLLTLPFIGRFRKRLVLWI